MPTSPAILLTSSDHGYRNALQAVAGYCGIYLKQRHKDGTIIWGEAMNYLKYLVEEIHTTVVATVDDAGLPVTAAIDMMDYDEGGLYFQIGRASCRERV